MNYVDLIITIILVGFALSGLKRGFFIQVFDIIGFAFSLIFALYTYSYAAAILNKIFHLSKISASPIGFLAVWLLSETLFFAVFDPIVKKLIVRLNYSKINKYFGFIPALANGLLFLSFVLLLLVSIPISPLLKKDVFDSYIASRLIASASSVERPFNSIFGPIAKQGLTFLTVKPEEKGSISLEFKQNKQTVDSISEQKMLILVNNERAKVGINPLIWDEERAKVARAHSADMFNRGYFSHYSPEGKDIGDRLEAASIEYMVAGENLALAPDLASAHIGLMNSPGHKRNILDPAYKKIGIGVIDGGIYGKMFTQVFTN